MTFTKKTKTETMTDDVADITVDESIPAVSTKVATKKDETKLDAQTRDMLKRVRDQKLVSGGRDPFFVSESDKKKGFSYRWASTDRDTPESIEYLEEIGWRKVEGYRTITTGGYTVNNQPGKHILMCLSNAIHEELKKIQDELNDRKKNAVFGRELLSNDGGKNKMGVSTKFDTSAKDDFLNNL